MVSWKNATFSPPASGILRPEVQEARSRRGRIEPHPDLATWVEHYWSVAWDLDDDTAFRAEVVSHPSVHVTVESGTVPRFGSELPVGLVHGVITRKFSVDISGTGRVFGVKFRPGGFGAFTGADVGAWTDRILPLAAAFGDASRDLIARVLGEPTDKGRADVLDDLLGNRLPDRDPRYEAVRAIIDDLRTDPALTTVDAVARRHGLSERTLQRLFRRYVGVGPKWVLQRYRLHDAVDLIDAGEHHDLAGLSVGLGWFDQAHFTREFTALVGQSPAAYAARRST
ncbi:AraC family transcriptional regulator [Nocardioides sp.]|uniref:AraC family transcriptional regulator n=1 Tax=Nocardioides sp. TaxID=35761 RepID=UPI0031FF1FFB|nr:Helix-turn-helix, AraC domain protein [Nocardioides sp.]